MIHYPSAFSDAARAKVEQALAQAELSWATEENRIAPRPFRPRADLGPEAHRVVFFVLEVFDAFVYELTDILISDPPKWSAESLRVCATDFLDDLVKHAYAGKAPRAAVLPQPLALSDFRALVLQ